jgi:hypothetical protein
MTRANFLGSALLGIALLGGCAPGEEAGGDGGFLPTGSTSGSGNSSSGATSTAGANGVAGTPGAGGMSGAGGQQAMSGAGGMSTAGGTGGGMGGAAGGSGGGSTGPQKTTGCGKDPGQALGAWQQYLVPLDGQTLGQPQTTHKNREIFVRLPPNYDSSKPYRIVYIGVGCSSPNGRDSAYPLWDTNQGGDADAIYVGLSLPDPSTNNDCYDNRAGVNSIEWESLDHDHAFVSDKFCIDNDKVYMGGYSSGGWIANMFSCYFGEPPAAPPRKFLPNIALRGVMAVAGCWIDGNPMCNGPVAGLWIHDENDGGANPYSCAVEQKNRLLEQNGCTGGAGGPTEKWGADFFNAGSCVKYTNCPKEYPVIFCTTTGRGHGSQNDNVIPGFNKFVDELEATVP